MQTPDAVPPAPRTPPKWPAAALRWGRLCTCGSFLVLITTELFGTRWPIVALTPFIPQLTCVAVLGVLLIASTRLGRQRNWRQDRVAMTLGCLAALYAGAVTANCVPARIVPAAPVVTDLQPVRRSIKVLSANVHTGNTDHQKVLDLIRKENPDIILLMELNTQWVEKLEPLRDGYPTSRVVPDDAGNFGIGFWTRLNVIDAQLVLLKAEEPSTLYDVPQVEATLEIPDALGQPRVVHFIGLHPLPPVRPGMASARDAVLEGAASSIAKNANVATIVAGDLNASRYCRSVQSLARSANLKDAASDLRFSWPNTWSRFAMGIRIDHVLVSDDWLVVRTYPGADIGSDHVPIIAELQFAK